MKPEAAAAAAAAPVRFNLQDNEKWLPLSGPCKSNWRRHYSAVIGSFVYKGGLSKLISQFRAKARHTLDASTMRPAANVCNTKWSDISRIKAAGDFIVMAEQRQPLSEAEQSAVIKCRVDCPADI